MRALFLRVYLALGLGLVVSFALVLWLLPAHEEPGLHHLAHELTELWPNEVAGRFVDATDVAARQAIADELEAERGYSVGVIPEGAVVGTVGGLARRALGQREPLVQFQETGPAVYVPLADQPFVVVLRPPPDPPMRWSARSGALAVVFLLLAVGGATYVVIRPLEGQLVAIAEASQAIADGDFAARATVTRTDAAGRLADSFNGMAEQVGTMVKGREALLHAVSHELRTPLARLRFAVELLEGEADASQRGRRVQEIQGDVQELEDLVAELLRYAELEGDPRLNLEDVDVGVMMSDLTTDVRRLRPGLMVTCEILPVPLVKVDRRLSHRALTNLVNNAARYADSAVLLRVELDGDRVRVQVEDDGPGVPEEDRERIFDPFVRLDAARSKDRGGLGLGLPLARRAARVHGGDIRVSTSSLGGARFTLTVPSGLPGTPRESTTETLWRLTAGRLTGRREKR